MNVIECSKRIPLITIITSVVLISVIFWFWKATAAEESTCSCTIIQNGAASHQIPRACSGMLNHFIVLYLQMSFFEFSWMARKCWSVITSIFWRFYILCSSQNPFKGHSPVSTHTHCLPSSPCSSCVSFTRKSLPPHRHSYPSFFIQIEIFLFLLTPFGFNLTHKCVLSASSKSVRKREKERKRERKKKRETDNHNGHLRQHRHKHYQYYRHFTTVGILGAYRMTQPDILDYWLRLIYQIPCWPQLYLSHTSFGGDQISSE